MALKYKNIFFTLNNIEKMFILNKAIHMTKDYHFLKKYILNIMTAYLSGLDLFIQKYQKLFSDQIKPQEKNNLFYRQKMFLFSIPNLITRYNKNFEINYVFLDKAFKQFETEDDKIKWLKKVDEIDNLIANNNPSKEKGINFLKLYQFGGFILSFLTDFTFRKEIIEDLLIESYKYNNVPSYKKNDLINENIELVNENKLNFIKNWNNIEIS